MSAPTVAAKTSGYHGSLDIINLAYVAFSDEYAETVRTRVAELSELLCSAMPSCNDELEGCAYRAAENVCHWQEEARDFPKNGWNSMDMRRLHYARNKVAELFQRRYGIALSLPAYTGNECLTPTPAGASYGEHAAVCTMRPAANCEVQCLTLKDGLWGDREQCGVIDTSLYFGAIYHALLNGYPEEQYQGMQFVDLLQEFLKSADLSALFGFETRFSIESDGECYLGSALLLPDGATIDSATLKERFTRLQRHFQEFLAARDCYAFGADRVLPWRSDWEPAEFEPEELDVPVPPYL